jgi:pyrroloquinoline quinone biosynthesis protein B
VVKWKTRVDDQVVIKVLGSAAGGGLPQWNCACGNCFRVRSQGILQAGRLQSQVAISPSGRDWHLLNASPDLRLQIELTSQLQPQSQYPVRQSPILSVTLTNADLDHILGLLLLRESQPLSIYCTKSVSEILRRGNIFFEMLQQFEGQTQWIDISHSKRFELPNLLEPTGRIAIEPFGLEGSAPLYARKSVLFSGSSFKEPVVGLIVDDVFNRTRFGYFPSVSKMTGQLFQAISSCDILFFDGTFWCDDEMHRTHGKGRTSREMGHIPISGEGGSLDIFSKLGLKTKKYFIHLNNTNPVLDPSHEAFAQITEAGWELTTDGMDYTL